MAWSQPGISATGYSALDAKNSGMVMAWPMPISRSRVRTMPAIDIDRQEKNAEARTTTTTTPSRRNGFQVMPTPISAAITMTTAAWITAFTPAAKALPVTRAVRGVGVTMSLVRTPESRSQMIMMP